MIKMKKKKAKTLKSPAKEKSTSINSGGDSFDNVMKALLSVKPKSKKPKKKKAKK